MKVSSKQKKPFNLVLTIFLFLFLLAALFVVPAAIHNYITNNFSEEGKIIITIPKEETMTFSSGEIIKASEDEKGNLIIRRIN